MSDTIPPNPDDPTPRPESYPPAGDGRAAPAGDGVPVGGGTPSNGVPGSSTYGPASGYAPAGSPGATGSPVAPGFPGGPVPPRKSPLPLLALIFGAVAFLVAVIPPTTGITWLFAIAAIVLGIIALVKRTPPRWMAPVGMGLAVIAWIISIVLVVAGIGSALNSLKTPVTAPADPQTSAAPQTSDSSSPSASPSDDAAKDETAAIGETVTNNKKISFTVHSITCGIAKAGPQFLEQTAKGQFCEVKYTIQNGSQDKISLFASDLTGTIGTATYDADGGITTFGEDYFTTDVNPGLSADVDSFIDIPAGAKLDDVVYKPQFSLFTSAIKVKAS